MRKAHSMFRVMAVIAAVCMLSGCDTSQNATPQAAVMAEVNVREVAEKADPQKAAEEIYAQLEDRTVRALGEEEFEEIFGVMAKDVQEFLACESDPKAGLADLAIVLPKTDRREAVRDILLQYRDKKVEEYRNYDILDSLSIAQSAEVFDQGEYLILLMMPDNEAARDIIDQYMPL